MVTNRLVEPCEISADIAKTMASIRQNSKSVEDYLKNWPKKADPLWREGTADKVHNDNKSKTGGTFRVWTIVAKRDRPKRKNKKEEEEKKEDSNVQETPDGYDETDWKSYQAILYFNHRKVLVVEVKQGWRAPPPTSHRVAKCLLRQFKRLERQVKAMEAEKKQAMTKRRF